MTTKSAPPVEHLDVLIVGAGLSGIGAACLRLRAIDDGNLAFSKGRPSELAVPGVTG
jgi:cation diffusion facilitator CzcD-associated flavoprotein CzcO